MRILIPLPCFLKLFPVVQTKEQFSNFFSSNEHLNKEVHGTSQLRLVVGGSATLRKEE